MAAAMIHLADRPILARRMGEAARNRVAREFSQASSLARLSNVLERAAGARS